MCLQVGKLLKIHLYDHCVSCTLHERQVIFFGNRIFFLRFILKGIQLLLFLHQEDLFAQNEKNFEGEIAIRSRVIGINKEVPSECSHDCSSHLKLVCFGDSI